MQSYRRNRDYTLKIVTHGQLLHHATMVLALNQVGLTQTAVLLPVPNAKVTPTTLVFVQKTTRMVVGGTGELAAEKNQFDELFACTQPEMDSHNH